MRIMREDTCVFRIFIIFSLESLTNDFLIYFVVHKLGITRITVKKIFPSLFYLFFLIFSLICLSFLIWQKEITPLFHHSFSQLTRTSIIFINQCGILLWPDIFITLIYSLYPLRLLVNS